MAARPFRIRWADAIDQASREGAITGSTHHVLATMAHGLNERGQVTVGEALLSSTTGKHRRTVERAQQEGVKAGLLARLRRGLNRSGTAEGKPLLSRWQAVIPGDLSGVTPP